MIEFRFEWDPRKNRENIRKHGISFEEASTAFRDDHALVFDDPDHSTEEARFLLLGLSSRLRVVVVCHCFREREMAVRVISARKGNRTEEADYWRRRK